MVAALVERASVASRLDAIEAVLDALDPAAYLDQTPEEARRTAARVQRLQARLAAHTAAAVRAGEALVPVGLGGSTGTADLLARDFGRDRVASGNRDGWQFRRDDHGHVQTRGPDGRWRDSGRCRATGGRGR